jgi:citronellol/citronellal dehydrogenase
MSGSRREKAAQSRGYAEKGRSMAANSLAGKTLFITGASRGIGLAIALRAASDGANVTIAAKTTTPHPRLPGTIHSAAEAIEAAGGRALPLAVDIRDEAEVESAVAQTVATFGGLDILVNNASAISLTGTIETPMKRYDLMQQVNTRGTFLCTQKCIPHLKAAANPHVLMLAPPLDLAERWFAPHVAYAIAKYGMSLCVLGMAGEFRADGIAVNALWPRTIIGTAALQAIASIGADERLRTRSPEIVADAAHAILTRDARACTGQFLLDDDVLRAAGVTDFSKYRHPGVAEDDLLPDLFL